MKCFYSPGYYLPLPEGHPFPISKYGDSFQLLESSSFCQQLEFKRVAPASMEDLLRVHTKDYLGQIRDGTLSKYARNRLGLPHHPRILERNLLDVSGTIEASYAALNDGIAWNLGGGTHHSMPDEGLGFCVTNDVSVAVLKIIKDYPDLNILILDTDAHQGNGNHKILRQIKNVFTYSIHVGANYPAVKEPGDMDIELPRYVEGEIYLGELESSLNRLNEVFQPDLIYWVSGVDVHEQDKFGQMKLSTRHLYQRNQIVMDYMHSLEAHLVGTYGGGYHKDPEITAQLHANTVTQTLS